MSDVQGLTVLIAEDEKDIRDMAKFLLGDLGGATVIAVPNGQEGYEEYIRHYDTENHQSGIDVILTDINMPQQTGFEMLEAIRNYEDRQQHHAMTPAVIMTAKKENIEEISQSDIEGITDSIEKPFADMEKLSAMVAEAGHSVNNFKQEAVNVIIEKAQAAFKDYHDSEIRVELIRQLSTPITDQETADTIDERDPTNVLPRYAEAVNEILALTPKAVLTSGHTPEQEADIVLEAALHDIDYSQLAKRQESVQQTYPANKQNMDA